MLFLPPPPTENEYHIHETTIHITLVINDRNIIFDSTSTSSHDGDADHDELLAADDVHLVQNLRLNSPSDDAAASFPPPKIFLFFFFVDPSTSLARVANFPPTTFWADANHVDVDDAVFVAEKVVASTNAASKDSERFEWRVCDDGG
jgi:hypothetical protein